MTGCSGVEESELGVMGRGFIYLREERRFLSWRLGAIRWFVGRHNNRWR